MPVGQIFFSYSRVDGKFALKLGEDLRKAGVDIWIDQIDIRPSEPWDEEIEKALQASNCLLVILSHTSVDSDNVLNEINFAIESKKQVLPILIENNIKKPFNIGRLQHIDFTASYDTGFNMLLKSLSLENPVPTKKPVSLSRAKKISIFAVPIAIVMAFIIFNFNKPGTGNVQTLQKDVEVRPSSPAPDPSTINGKWSTVEVTNPFDEHDKYIIYFDFEVFGKTLVGTVNMKSTIEDKNYDIKKGFLGGKIEANTISFYTLEQQTDNDGNVTYKNTYYGSILNDTIQFNLQSDRPYGFPGQKFVARRAK